MEADDLFECQQGPEVWFAYAVWICHSGFGPVSVCVSQPGQEGKEDNSHKGGDDHDVPLPPK